MLVLDNLNTHSPASLYELLPPDRAKRLADRLEIDYTPKHGSWLNMAEIELSVAGKRLPGRIPGLTALAGHCRALVRERNRQNAGVDWLHRRQRPHQTQTALPINRGAVNHH